MLYPQTQLMGTGDVSNAANGGKDANVLWVQDGNYNGARPAVRDDFVAWPPPGYVPYDLVPARWSLSSPNADFSTASVSVTRAGQAVPVQFEAGANGADGYGENTLHREACIGRQATLAGIRTFSGPPTCPMRHGKRSRMSH